MTDSIENHYETNLALLQKYHPHAWEIISQNVLEETGELILADNGMVNLRAINQEGEIIFFHDQHNPQKEVDGFLKMVPENSTGFITMTGMGLGYSPREILKQRKSVQFMAVLEAEPGVFRQAMRAMDLKTMLADPRLILCLGTEQLVPDLLKQANRALQLENIHILAHTNSLRYNQEDYQNLHDAMYNHVNQLNLGGVTTIALGHDFLNNRLKHLSAIHHNQLLEKLQDKFCGVPAIIVASGPSLDKNIHHLLKAQGKSIIIAVDSAIPSLVAHGISPDFITAIDPLKVIYEKIAETAAAPAIQNSSMICMSWVNYKVPKTFPAKQVFWCLSAKPIERFVNKLMGGTVLTSGAATVAHLNIISAIIMGCSPIVFVGQDLAFSDTDHKSSHSSHTVLMEDDVVKSLQDSNQLVWLDGVNGSKVPSKRSFLSHKVFFEEMIAEYDSRQFINATEGGAHIKGTNILPLETVINRYCQTDQDITNKIHACDKKTEQKIVKNLISEFIKLKKTGSKQRKLINQADRLTKQVLTEMIEGKYALVHWESLQEVPQEIQQKLTEIDSYHARLDQKNSFWSLMDEITMEALRDSIRDKQEIDTLADIPKQFKVWLQKSMQRLLVINKARLSALSQLLSQITTNLNHLKKERQLLKIGEKLTGANKDQNLLELARLYFNSGDLVQARPIVAKLRQQKPESAEILFYQGCLAAHYTQYDKADSLFDQASQDPQVAGKINQFRQELGDEYLQHAEFFRTKDSNTYKRMLFKGIRYSPGHEKLSNSLISIADNDLAKYKSAGNTLEREDKHLLNWCNELLNNNNLCACLQKGRVAELFRYCGQLLSGIQKFSEAEACFRKSLEISKDNPEYHIMLTDVLFAQDNFVDGIKHLEQAVKISRTYAKYWNNIGDNLFASKQYQNAIYAYEQGFIALPENIDLLRKLGECYQQMGEHEAATESFNQFKLHNK